MVVCGVGGDLRRCMVVVWVVIFGGALWWCGLLSLSVHGGGVVRSRLAIRVLWPWVVRLLLHLYLAPFSFSHASRMAVGKSW